jgi:hypothetical protein
MGSGGLSFRSIAEYPSFPRLSLRNRDGPLGTKLLPADSAFKIQPCRKPNNAGSAFCATSAVNLF